MAYRFQMAGVEVKCDTLDELLEAVKAGMVDTASGASEVEENRPRERDRSSKRPKGPQGKGPKKAWDEARAYADEHGISIMEARGILSQKRKNALEKALGSLDDTTSSSSKKST